VTRPAHDAVLHGPNATPARFGAADSPGVADGARGVAGLVRRAQAGDNAAFERLVADRIDAAYRLALAIVRSEADARDAVQEAYVAAWRQLPRLRDPARFDQWVNRIVINACRMALRHRRVVRIREVAAEPWAILPMGDRSVAAGRGPDELVAEADLVRRALLRLSVSDRAVLVLHHAQDLPVGEIAAALGLPTGTVKWRLHGAREALRRAVEEESR